MGVRVSRAVLVFACVAALAQAAASQTRSSRSHGRKQPRLYYVSDERGRPGFIDSKGRLVIGFDRLSGLAFVSQYFSEGLAPACVLDAEKGYCAELGYGYIDESGRFVIAPRFRAADVFRGGLALVYASAQEGGGFINRRGELVIKVPDGSGVVPFSEGLAAVSEAGRVKYIDGSGRAVINEAYAYALSFSEGLAAVTDRRTRGAKYGFIDKRGKLVIPMRFEPEYEHHGFLRNLSSFHGGRASVKVGNAYGFIDTKGDLVIPAEFSLVGEFAEGFACVWRRNPGVCEFIDARGRRAFGRTFNHCGSFSEGLASVAVETKGGEKWGYIDRRGRFVIEPRFDEAYPFYGELAQVAVSEGVRATAEWYAKMRPGYIDRRGRYVWRKR